MDIDLYDGYETSADASAALAGSSSISSGGSNGILDQADLDAYNSQFETTMMMGPLGSSGPSSSSRRIAATDLDSPVTAMMNNSCNSNSPSPPTTITSLNGGGAATLSNGVLVRRSVGPSSTGHHRSPRMVPNRVLVHIDLKGAPPMISYLMDLLPVIKRLGATGLVLEYEDTFPYITHQLSQLPSSHFHYNREELAAFLDECDSLGLEIIPLIQTFGHVEFILKHEAFKSLREHPWYPNCVCPSNPEVIKLLKEIIQQILEFHPNSAAIHIGCDEVWQLCICDTCIKVTERKGWSRERLFAEHVIRLANYIKECRPDIEILIWDDMLRLAPSSVVVDSKLHTLVKPVVWYYGAQGCPNVWNMYSSLFPTIWCASAYKGASGSCEVVPDTMLHVDNHKLWMAIMEDQQGKVERWGGLILTGWSRYDHFGILCELLPASIPSLLLSLSTIKHGCFSEEAHLEASTVAGSHALLPLSQKPRFKGWFHPHNVKRNFVNPGTVRQLQADVNRLLDELERLHVMMLKCLPEIYTDTVVNEWLDTHVITHIRKLRKLTDKMKEQIRVSEL